MGGAGYSYIPATVTLDTELLKFAVSIALLVLSAWQPPWVPACLRETGDTYHRVKQSEPDLRAVEDAAPQQSDDNDNHQQAAQHTEQGMLRQCDDVNGV